MLVPGGRGWSTFHNSTQWFTRRKVAAKLRDVPFLFDTIQSVARIGEAIM